MPERIGSRGRGIFVRLWLAAQKSQDTGGSIARLQKQVGDRPEMVGRTTEQYDMSREVMMTIMTLTTMKSSPEGVP